MSENTSAEVFVKIEEDARNHLSGDKLRNALDFIAYLKDSGRTWTFSDYHPEFCYMGELTCLISYHKFDETTLNYVRQIIEAAGNRFANDLFPSWNICCWQHEDDLYEPDSFPVDEDLKDFARSNVWKCIRCGGCGTPGGGRRTVFGKEFDNACCNVFQFVNPDNEMLEKIKILMELQKHIIADSKKK